MTQLSYRYPVAFNTASLAPEAYGGSLLGGGRTGPLDAFVCCLYSIGLSRPSCIQVLLGIDDVGAIFYVSPPLLCNNRLCGLDHFPREAELFVSSAIGFDFPGHYEFSQLVEDFQGIIVDGLAFFSCPAWGSECPIDESLSACHDKVPAVPQHLFLRQEATRPIHFILLFFQDSRVVNSPLCDSL